MFMIPWIPYGSYTDIKYHKIEGIAKITINRPEVRNAFRPQTVEEMRHALNDARNDGTIGVILLTGEGKEAFCSGGDQKIRGDSGYVDLGGTHRLNVLDFQREIRSCPKPVIAVIAGYAVGGGHVLHVVCDLSIAAENAVLVKQDLKWALLMVALDRVISPELLGKKKRVKFGFCVDSITQKRLWRWGLSIALSLTKNSRRLLSTGRVKF